MKSKCHPCKSWRRLFGGLPRSPMKDVTIKKMVVGAPTTHVSERNFVPQKILTPASTLRTESLLLESFILCDFF